MSDSTSLRVYWSGQLRLYNCDQCCRRWYFTFNGAECSAPAAIDAVVYMRYGTGSRLKNLHRPRHVEGVCDKIHKGTVRVGFWVGNCAGYGSADANTGWDHLPPFKLFTEQQTPIPHFYKLEFTRQHQPRIRYAMYGLKSREKIVKNK